MNRENASNGPDPRVVYADVIGLPHHRSAKHPHMSLYDRSAQFASYKALTGYEDMVAEEARWTEALVRPEDYELSVMDRKLALIDRLVKSGSRPVLTFTVFVPDDRKAGGAYADVTGTVRRIDTAERAFVLAGAPEDGGQDRTVAFDSVVGISGESVDFIGDGTE